MASLLKVYKDEGPPTDFPLEKPEITVGRSDDNDIVLGTNFVSRRHLRLTRKDADYVLTDLDSFNGTIVNGESVKTVKLKPGDEIRLGPHKLVFVIEAPPPAAEAASAPAPAPPPASATMVLSRAAASQTMGGERNLLNFIRKIPLFSAYTDAELDELLTAAEFLSVKAGELLFDQGDAGDKLFLVYAGKVRIIQRTGDQKEVNLGVRTKGDHFGEIAVITGKPRTEAARAVEDCLLVSISAAGFNGFLLGKPKLREYFDKVLRFSSIYQFIKASSGLAAAAPAEIQELARRFKVEVFAEGDAVFRQGTAPDKFYLVEMGRLKVVRWEGKTPRTINFLRDGDFFGEKSLFEDKDRSADVVCLTPCHVLALAKEDFLGLIKASPKLRKVIEDRIQSYRDAPATAYTEIIKQEMAALKPIAVAKTPAGPEGAAPKPRRKLFGRLRRVRRFPFIEQYDQMTCGTTCIMMVAKHFGKTFASSRLRDLAYVDLSGASLANLAHAAEQLGFSTRGLKLGYDGLRSVALPCIVHWKSFHYIVVYKIDEKHVWVSDPAIGHRRYTRAEFEEGWAGITLTIEPTVAFEKTAEDASSVKNFLQFVLPYKTILFEVLVASFLLNLFGLATPIFTQNIVDKVLVHQNMSMLNLMLVGMLIVAVFRIMTMIVRQYLIVHTGMKIDLRMLVQFYKHLLSLPLKYFKVRKIGDFMARFEENLKIRNFFTETALTIVLDAVLIVVYIFLMLYYSSKLTLLVLVFFPILVGMTLVFTPILKRLNVKSFGAKAEAQSHLIESIQAIDTVKAMNVEHPIRWRWENKFVKNLNIDFKLMNTSLYFNSIGDLVGTVSSTVILWAGAQSVLQGRMSVGELMAFMSLIGSVLTPLNRIIYAWDDIQQARVSIDRLNEVFTAVPELAEGGEGEKGIVLKAAKGEITFEKVHFRFGGKDDPYILSNINLKITPGQRVAIVGRSGSGKTTLAKLISRFYDVTEGKILIDGLDIKSLNLPCLRQTVGFVLQENFLFNATIRENIALGDPDGPLDRIVEAASLANAHDFIANMALGYDTRVGESGLQLSGGQKQRISIARVLYARPKILIFDEATSSLDTESEQAIQKNLDDILKDKTAIIIAHRLSTVRNADHIIVLDNGEIVEQGRHQELMDKKGLYHYLNFQQLNI